MKERPILFQGAMVRALLAGTKMQTRRAMRFQPHDEATVTVEHFHQTVVDRHGDEQPGPEIFGAWWADGECGARCPYGAPGDRLWVRESWGYRGAMFSYATPDLQDIYIRYRADDPQPELARSITCKRGEHDANLPKQRAQREGESRDDYEDYLDRYWKQWRPSIHMPRWASRITLEVTGLRVERLQAISETDAAAEGVEPYPNQPGRWLSGHRPSLNFPSAVAAYRDLWESINGAGSWDANPWVWVVEFKRANSPSLEGE